ncbi:MAG: hypothetical protein WB870_10355 [Gallionellaceae bacterium]
MRSNELIFRAAKLFGAVSLLIGFQVAVAQVDDPPPVPLRPSLEYHAFLDKFAYSEKVDAFYFFRNFPDFKGKVIMVDARFQKKITNDMIFAKIWRNFGTMTLIVTDIPEGEHIPENQPFLLVGRMTDFKNEVVNGALESMPIIKFMGKYVCKDFRCNQ